MNRAKIAYGMVVFNVIMLLLIFWSYGNSLGGFERLEQVIYVTWIFWILLGQLIAFVLIGTGFLYLGSQGSSPEEEFIEERPRERKKEKRKKSKKYFKDPRDQLALERYGCRYENLNTQEKGWITRKLRKTQSRQAEKKAPEEPEPEKEDPGSRWPLTEKEGDEI